MAAATMRSNQRPLGPDNAATLRQPRLSKWRMVAGGERNRRTSEAFDIIGLRETSDTPPAPEHHDRTVDAKQAQQGRL